MSDWRHGAAADAVVRYLKAVPAPGPALVLRDPLADVADALAEGGAEVTRWDRALRPGVEVSPWPPEGPYALAALRLPKAKDEVEMLVHAAASRLEPGGVLLVYGANDEGIRSADGRVEPLLGTVHTVMRKNRCRVLRAERPAEVEGLRGGLEAWRETWTLDVEGLTAEWVSYPGVFAHGRLDPGTAMLLEVVGYPPPGSGILDFGCGSGVVAGVLRAREPTAEVDLLDVDTVALAAARENVPEGRTILSDGFAGTEDVFYDRIVTNPPYHRSKEWTMEVVGTLIEEAPDRLTPDGALTMVVQRRLPVREPLEEAFGEVEILAEDGTYRVWTGTRPRQG